jgi:SSS family solute:Na+ symporter
MKMEFIDWIVIAAYFAAVFGVAFAAAFRKKATRETSAGYFLAGRNVGWFVIGASLFASNIGSEHLVGLAGAGAAGQFPLGQYEVQASLFILLLGWVFAPFYLRSGVFTMPEFLERRYSPATRWYLALVCIIGYVLTKISVTVAAGGIVIHAVTGMNFWTGAIIVVAATGVYTIFGGLRAVLYTDMLQMFILVAGSFTVLVLGLYELGGWDAMVATAEPGMLSLWRPMTDPDFPWTGIIFGAPIVHTWYWCTDQFIVQRVLAARNLDQARLGTIWGAFIKQSALFIFVIPGVIAYCLCSKGMLELPEADQALPKLITTLLPVGLRGLVVAGLLAALMSSLSSVFNSCSTLVTIDVYKKLRPEASERRLVVVGQISTAVLVALGLAWIPFMKLIAGELYHYLQSVQAYISPPIGAAFLLGVFWKRVNSKGAIVSLITGFILGMGRLVLEIVKNSIAKAAEAKAAVEGITEDAALAAHKIAAVKDAMGDGFIYAYTTMNFMHVAIFLTVVCAGILVVVSLLTRPDTDEKLAGLTYQTTPIGSIQSAARSRAVEIVASVFVIAMIVFILSHFR